MTTAIKNHTALMYCKNPACREYNREQPTPTDYTWETCHTCGSLLATNPDKDAPELNPHSIRELFADQPDNVEGWDWMAQEALPVIAAWYRLTQWKGHPWERTRNEDEKELMRIVRKYGENKPSQT